MRAADCNPFVGKAQRAFSTVSTGRLPQKLAGFLAERVGFEPTVGCPITSFQDWLLKPLGHLSIDETNDTISGVKSQGGRRDFLDNPAALWYRSEKRKKESPWS